jgi:hypothetical protein
MYTFQSRAAPDLIMLRESGDKLMVLLGKPPGERGIIQVGDMPATIQTLTDAIGKEPPLSNEAADGDEADPDAPERHAVSLRQRLWPFIVLLKTSLAEEQPVTWDV